MSLRINSNVAALTAARQLNQAQRKAENAMDSLATGSRFSRASNDPAGLAVAQTLKAQIQSNRAAQRNTDQAISLIQVAEGGLNEQNNILIRMRELAVQSASDTLSDTERNFLDLEFQELLEEMDRIGKTTSFGNKKLLVGSGESFDFQVGVNKGDENVVRYQLKSDTTSEGLGIDSLGIADQDDALDSLEELDSAIISTVEARADFGAIQSRLEFAQTNSEIQDENLSAARSRIEDTDIARATGELVRSQIATQVATAVLAQANQTPESVIRLI